jgi:hypothetical protein
MIYFVCRGVLSFRVFPCHSIFQVALFAEIEIEALIAFVPNVGDWHDTAPITLDVLLHSLAGLDNSFNMVRLGIVSSDSQALIGGCEVTILAQTKMRAICAYKTSTDDRLHVATHTFIVAVSSQAVSQ